MAVRGEGTEDEEADSGAGDWATHQEAGDEDDDGPARC